MIRRSVVGLGGRTIHELADCRSITETTKGFLLSTSKRVLIARFDTLDEALAAAALDGTAGYGGASAVAWFPTAANPGKNVGMAVVR